MIIDRLDYVVSVRSEGHSGKEKATAEKISALRRAIRVVNVYQIDGYLLWFSPTIASFFLECRYFFCNIFSKQKPEVIITRSIWGFGTYLVSKVRRVPVIHELHADFLDEAKILFKGKKLVLAKLLYRWSLFFLSRSSGIIFNNSRLEAYYKEKLPNISAPFIVVQNGTDVAAFYPMDQKAAQRRLGLDPHYKYLLFLGSMNPWHGVNYVLEVFRKVITYYGSDSYRLLLVGGGGSMDSMANDTSGHCTTVIVTGIVGHRTAKDYIASADLCLAPVCDRRVSPGSPLKLFDYAACGRPIAAQANVPGYGDVVTSYGLGISVDFTAPSEAAGKIVKFVCSGSFSHFQRYNRQVAEDHFGWSNVISKWLVFSDYVISRGPNSSEK